ncbi:spore wall protein 2 [Cyprinodon tularosa]|uniref:spore wall protein 2 n=1 Tax=Cyprinodon tularosa TaxID=77115 RepID=UPI0018E284F8|nr:spore wall protein 2 [Cyprinodon tularosa]XP_038164435.1 spore wall protein 2 [Cyprinodon tularosa]
MAATEASAAPVVQEEGKTPENKPVEAEQPAKTANSETVNSEVVDKDGTAINTEVVENKETVSNDTAAAAVEEAGGEEEGAAAGGEEAPPQSSENTTTEPKTSFLDSFLNKSGLGKVMAGRKKRDHTTATGGAEEAAPEGGEKEGDKRVEEGVQADGAGEGGAKGEAATDKPAENGEKEEEKKGKPAETKHTVRDLIRKPVARIFSHRSTEKKDGGAGEPEKKVKVRSRSLDRLEDPEALNATTDSTVEEGGEAGGTEGEQKASSSSASTKHMKRWHSFKKLMAQKTHKKSGGGEDWKEEGAEGEGGGGDSSTLDSKESGHKRWKLKRSWTFQGLKRDSSVVGISGKAKSSDKESGDKTEEGTGGGEGEEKEEAKAEAEPEEAKTEGGEDKAEGGEEVKAAGGGTVTQHANEIWTSFKKRVIPKSKRANTECAPTGEEDANAAAVPGEEANVDEGKDSKSAKAKRSHFGRAVSLKNFIMRKGKSGSVDQGEGATEEGEAAEGGDAAEEGGADGEAEEVTKETNDKEAATEEKTEPEETTAKEEKEPEQTATEAPGTNGETGCSNGVAEENATENHHEEDKEQPTESSPVKKSKESGGVKDDANAKIINATAAVNSDKKAGNV